MRRHGIRLLVVCLGVVLLAPRRAESTPSFDLYVSTSGVAQLAVGQTLPWTIDYVPERSMFNDDRGYRDLHTLDDMKRWEAIVVSARLTISAWKDGIASGCFEIRTSRGVTVDTAFRAPMQDRAGALARASATVAPGAGQPPPSR